MRSVDFSTYTKHIYHARKITVFSPNIPKYTWECFHKASRKKLQYCLKKKVYRIEQRDLKEISNMDKFLNLLDINYGNRKHRLS